MTPTIDSETKGTLPQIPVDKITGIKNSGSSDSQAVRWFVTEASVHLVKIFINGYTKFANVKSY